MYSLIGWNVQVDWRGDEVPADRTEARPADWARDLSSKLEFGNMEGVGKAKAERWLRSAGPPKTKVEADEDGEEDEEEDDSQQSDLDPFELLDPVEILTKLPKNFYKQVSDIFYAKRSGL